MGSISVCRKPPHAKTFGVELECYPTPSHKNNEVFRDYNTGRVTHLGFWEITSDASLGYGGYEFVSQPMPYDMMVKQIKKIHQTLGGWTTRDDCGLHIHVSRQMWSEKRRRDFDDFLYYGANCTYLIKWFGRSSRYALPQAAHADHDYKFRAINLLHPATYEFRVWKAGDLDWTLEALRRTRAIVLHQGKYTVEWMNKLCKIKDEPKPASSLVSTFQQAANIPAVRRIRRA